MNIRPLDLASARKILDFSGGNEALRDLGQLQLEGAVALHNMIADPEVGMGYLADEVGMGKTYVALGVVSLLRYFNPSLRVLYICPSNNVQEKWYLREYHSFIKNNVTTDHFKIRTLDGKPAVPRVSCRNVPELIRAASIGYYADIFVGMGSFSIALSDDDAAYRVKLNELKELLPATENYPMRDLEKQNVKDQYAKALNYVLPTFDLVVIDEAHNFKHDFTSSARNRVLSAALGFREINGEDQPHPRAKHALLLSATPYDRDINHLRNQLKLVVGEQRQEQLLPADITSKDNEQIQQYLSRFLVRRLNVLQIAGKPHTRNMYRREWRYGERAEIRLESDEQKLVTALVQKKVGEMLDQKGSSPSFQTGLLASFESYAESTKSALVEFDGEGQDRDRADARDKHIIGEISDSYVRASLGRTLPHPKMDSTAKRLSDALFANRRKQIVFVRRVKSVKELKNKLDDHYNDWLAGLIRTQLGSCPDALRVMNNVIDEYRQQSHDRNDDISGGEYVSKTGEAEDKQPPKNNTLFTWFFRGESPDAALPHLKAAGQSFTTPEAMRIGLSAKNQAISALLEINWATALSRLQGLNLKDILNQHGEEIAKHASDYTVGAIQRDLLEIYTASQLGFLYWYANDKEMPGLKRLVEHLKSSAPVKNRVEITAKQLTESLETHTLFCALEKSGLQHALFPRLREVLEHAIRHEHPDTKALQKLDVHMALVSLCLRTGHGVVDLYLARMRQGTENLTSKTRTAWMDDLARELDSQSRSNDFSSYWELHNLSEHFDLIIKNNLPEIYDKTPDEYKKHLAQTLNPVAPVIGATGETVSSRSAQARKFRMPGYPLALISTDVFQEGEDLHTFCDSVMHYGLSGSPVSIEQKTGRVDRVGSMAQRRLVAYGSDHVIDDEQLIQVTFPFVRESIELLQVRQLCSNINQFIRSLHKVGSEPAPVPVPVQDHIEMDEAFKDRSGVPDQILTFLESPYVPRVEEKIASLNREQLITDQSSQTKRIVKHVKQLLDKRFSCDSVLGSEGIHLKYPDRPRRPIRIQLRSAKASGEILLCAEIQDQEVNLENMSHETLHKLMLEKSWRTFHRTYAVETASGLFQLHHDAELLVGDEHDTTPGEIDRFFERFILPNHDPGDYGKPKTRQTYSYWAKAVEINAAHFGQWKTGVSDFEENNCLGLTFSFGDTGLRRKHSVRIYEVEERCIFLAQAASAERVKELTPDQLVKFTWQRNKHIDVVEFMLDDEMALVGRAIHPIDGMDFKEFLYCAYTLAATTDRLEFLIQEPDLY